MNDKTTRSASRTALTLLTVSFAGVLLSPLAVYLFGSTVMGPYEGEGGLAGFAGGVFMAAAAGKVGALALLLTPVALVLTWWLIAKALRNPPVSPKLETNNS